MWWRIFCSGFEVWKYLIIFYLFFLLVGFVYQLQIAQIERWTQIKNYIVGVIIIECFFIWSLCAFFRTGCVVNQSGFCTDTCGIFEKPDIHNSCYFMNCEVL
jgi:hypothetical protein